MATDPHLPTDRPTGSGATRATLTATMLVVDQVTSTERITDLGTDAAFEERERLLGLVDAEVRNHGGRVDFACGDGAIARFDTADAAHAAATTLRDGVHVISPAGAPAPARLRAAVHVDEVVLDDHGRPFGLGVVIAVRSCAFANPDGIVLTDRALNLMGSRPHQPIEWLGPVQLKGIPTPVCLWRSPGPRRRRPGADALVTGASGTGVCLSLPIGS